MRVKLPAVMAVNEKTRLCLISTSPSRPAKLSNVVLCGISCTGTRTYLLTEGDDQPVAYVFAKKPSFTSLATNAPSPHHW